MANLSRLASIDNSLNERIKSISPDQRLRIMIKICHTAINTSKLSRSCLKNASSHSELPPARAKRRAGVSESLFLTTIWMLNRVQHDRSPIFEIRSNKTIEKALELLNHPDKQKVTVRAKIRSLISQLDNKYIDLQEAKEVGRPVEQSEMLETFCRARAINTIYFALCKNTAETLGEVIYEANAAIDNLPMINNIIQEEIERTSTRSSDSL
jgi:hypothetical protein